MLFGEVLDSTTNLDYTIKVRNNSRSIRLQVSLQNGLEVSVPKGTSRKQIERVLSQNHDWIVDSLGQIPARLERVKPQEIELSAIGKRWNVEYEVMSYPRIRVEDSGEATLSVQGDLRDPYQVAVALRKWLGRRAQEHLVPWLVAVSDEFELPYGKVLVKAQRTRWGSCSSEKTISINRNLLFLPPSLVRYILIHELVHTVQLDHSRKFWELVSARTPKSIELKQESKKAWAYLPPWAYEK